MVMAVHGIVLCVFHASMCPYHFEWFNVDGQQFELFSILSTSAIAAAAAWADTTVGRRKFFLILGHCILRQGGKNGENENAMALNRRNLPKQRHPEAVDQVTVSVNGEDKISMGRHCLIMLHPEGEKDFSHLGNFWRVILSHWLHILCHHLGVQAHGGNIDISNLEHFDVLKKLRLISSLFVDIFVEFDTYKIRSQSK